MLVTCHFDGNNSHAVATYDVDATEVVENIMVLVEVEHGIPVAHQRWSVHGSNRVLSPHLSLAQQGVVGDRVDVHVRSAPTNILATSAATATRSPATATVTGQQPPPHGQASATELIESLFRGTPNALQQPRAPPPPPVNPDQLIAQLFQQPAGAVLPPQPVIDQDDPAIQARLYEEIQKQNLAENLANALEHTPEAFARVVMLYIPCTVNKVPITAFVDSGAQMSVMSARMAEQCGIMRLVDRRMSGVAKGVGTCKIIGRVHMTMVTLGSLVLPFSITILERQDMDFLIGLDQLKRHQMMIDLKANCLRIEDQAIPFLTEGELPPHLRAETNGEGEPDDEEAAAARGGKASSGGATATAPAAATAPTQPRQATPPPPPAPSAAHPRDAAIEEKIRTLMEMTQLPREAAEGALEAAAGNVDAAAALLLGM